MRNSTVKLEAVRDSKIHKEVSNRAVIARMHILAKKGFHLNDFLESVPYDEFYFINKRERIEWRAFCRIISNIGINFSPVDHEEVGAYSIKSGNFIEASLLFFLFTSKRFSNLISDKLFKKATTNFLCLKYQIEFIDSGKIKFITTPKDRYEELLELIFESVGFLKELCRQSKLKEYKVETELIPLEFYLSKNYPDPFSDKTKIKYCTRTKQKL